MSDVVLTVQGLSKKYTIHHRPPSEGLRHSLNAALTAPFRWLSQKPTASVGPASGPPPRTEEFYALRDIAFHIREGEVVGVMGRNGAGKSTLLKVLSRITEPTTGIVRLRGRVASLLEVGTGFHPELTGRENVYVNGAILGMSRAEIARRFDEIVAFAEVERFLDTPVKRYSSGMQVRLAFAVAAHLEAEILLVDEVLAVGDAEFQKRCLGKMNDVAASGRTVVLVSHNLSAVTTLCSRAIVLERGRVVADCGSREAIAIYLNSGASRPGERCWLDGRTTARSETVRLRSLRLVSNGAVTAHVDIDEPLDVQLEFETLQPGLRLASGIHLIHAVLGEVLASNDFPSSSMRRDDWYGRPLPVGVFRAVCVFPRHFLNEGSYSLNAVILRDARDVELLERDALHFEAFDGGSMRKEWRGGWLGSVRPRLEWFTEYLGPPAVQADEDAAYSGDDVAAVPGAAS